MYRDMKRMEQLDGVEGEFDAIITDVKLCAVYSYVAIYTSD